MAKQSKYKNKEIVIDGVNFKSIKEGNRYIELKTLQRDGKIKQLQLQPKFTLIESVKFKGSSRAKPAIRYFADFSYIDCKTGLTFVEDVKSVITKKSPVYRIKKHMMLAIHGIEVLET
ncbi:DUF1064 domain-containing protein [Psychrobacter sp. T6-6]|uniref:DUF1064 domain-containing protein n=1 Tax=Psychrobacter sp. T6-6 TaxID=3457452 RepID=UPI003FCF6F45